MAGGGEACTLCWAPESSKSTMLPLTHSPTLGFHTAILLSTTSAPAPHSGIPTTRSQRTGMTGVGAKAPHEAYISANDKCSHYSPAPQKHTMCGSQEAN